MSRNRRSGNTPVRGIDQEPGKQKGLLKKAVDLATAALVALFNKASDKKFDVKFGVTVVNNIVTGVRIVQVTGTAKNVAAYLQAKLENATALVSFGAKMWTEQSLVHAIAIEGPATRTSVLRRAIAKGFAMTQFKSGYAYYNMAGATDEATYVVNGDTRLQNAVHNGRAITNALLRAVFGKNNGYLRGANATALTLFAPDTPRVSFALSGNTAVTLPAPFADNAKYGCNMVGTRGFAAVQCGTNNIAWLTAAEIYDALANKTTTPKWNTAAIEVDGTIEDISLPVMIDGIPAPRLIASMTEGGTFSYVPLTVEISGGNLAFTPDLENAVKATKQTAKFGNIQTVDTQTGIAGVDRNGGEDAVYQQPWISLDAQIQAMATGTVNVDALIAAQQKGQGISTLPLPHVIAATQGTGQQRTRRPAGRAN